MPDAGAHDDIEMLRELLRELRTHNDHDYGYWTMNMRRRVAEALGEPRRYDRGPF